MSDHQNDHEPMDMSEDPLADAKFWDSFRSFGTNDRDDLVRQFRQYTLTTLTDKGITFFLELANWNLQAAIGAYYDSETPENADRVPSVTLIKDNTYGDGESVTPGTRFSKSWRFKNTGDECWPPVTEFHFITGELKPICAKKTIYRRIEPQEEFNIEFDLLSPNEPGTYKSQFGFRTEEGIPFGEMVWAIVPVDQGGILGITQQLQRFDNIGSSSSDRCSGTFGGNSTFQINPLFQSPPNGDSVKLVVGESSDVAQVTEGMDDIRLDDDVDSDQIN